MQVDHVKPLRIGGADEISNMLPTCRSCNHYKATLDVDGFRKYLSEIHKRLLRDSVAYQVAERFGIVNHVGDEVTFYFEKAEVEMMIERLTFVDENGEVLFHPEDFPEDRGIAITQLAENKRYKALEEIAERLANREQYGEMLEKELRQYRVIGKIDECRKAVGKQTVRKSINNDKCTCSSCGTYNEIVKKRRNTVVCDTVYCWHCGQAIECRRDIDLG